MQEQIQVKSFQFQTSTVAFYEAIETKSGAKEFYVEGYISTKALDLLNDIVTDECMEDMVVQIKGGSIKLDIEHETIHEDNLDKIPVGRIVDARKDQRGVWVKALLNKANERFQEVWGSVKNGMLDAFSIAFKPIQAITKSMQGKLVRMLHKVQLVNVGLTGTPVNPEARMTDIFVKALSSLPEETEEKSDSSNKSLVGGNDDEKMAEEKINSEANEDNEEYRKKLQGGDQGAQVSQSDDKPAETKADEDAKHESKETDKEEEDENDEKDEESKKTETKALAEVKALELKITSLETEVKSLTEENKMLKKELETPEMKALASDMPSTKSNIQNVRVTPLQLLA